MHMEMSSAQYQPFCLKAIDPYISLMNMQKR